MTGMVPGGAHPRPDSQAGVWRTALWLAVFAVALIFGAINLPSVGSWCFLGVRIRTFLTSPYRLRGFNWTMGVLLIGSLYPMLA